MRRSFILILLFLVVGIDLGCANPRRTSTYQPTQPKPEAFEGWNRPGATRQEFVQEKYLCTRESQALAYSRATPPPPPPPDQPYAGLGAGLGYGMQVGILQSHYFDECMEGHGWTK
jgi:hypothetical protein